MEQIERIEKMEGILNRSKAVLGRLDRALEDYASVRDSVAELSAYYGSGDWLADFESDRAGLLPADLKRGVLSEDAVYNLLDEERELICRMSELVSDAR